MVKRPQRSHRDIGSARHISAHAPGTLLPATVGALAPGHEPFSIVCYRSPRSGTTFPRSLRAAATVSGAGAELSRIGVIGNSLPRHCGIATFTSDLQLALAQSRPGLDTQIIAMTDHAHHYDYPETVRLEINDDCLADYIVAAEHLNEAGLDVVSLQHEFGIFGGAAGEYILALMERLEMPIVSTLHTVLADPTPIQRSVMDRLIAASARIVVMAEKGRHLLRSVYAVPDAKIQVIAHGIPDVAFIEPDRAKAKLGYGGRTVILTFGLLSPNKGIEVMIEAMPVIVAGCPDAVYVVLGATHPNLLLEQGESYRASLQARASELGVEDHVVFLDRFVDQPTLLDFIAMCDLYVTPYLTEAQMTSGTLAYSFGSGKAVVSTPYWHAQELLADGHGVLVPFGDVAAIGTAIGRLLSDEPRRLAMRLRAYASSRCMTWERTAQQYLAVFEQVGREHRAAVLRTGESAPVDAGVLPEVELGYFLSMCDDTGLFQHAIHSVPDRSHGYCVDDNARALLVACALNQAGATPLPDVLVARLAAFVQHAWNPDTRRFRNFMGFDRRWLEDRGSEDSHGRTLWALGVCARDDVSASRRRWAAALMREALPPVEGFTSPRAWALTLLGLDAYCATAPADAAAQGMQRLLADRLLALLAFAEMPDWVWFEDGLSYDNARLPQALIATGLRLSHPAYVDAGLRTLSWLIKMQTASAGFFRPVGSDTFGDKRMLPKPFDQQPLEAAATISACLAAKRARHHSDWTVAAGQAFAWFLGGNDLAVPLVDLDNGSCRDGLHADRPNENRGGESVVSYLLALLEMRMASRPVRRRQSLR
ncbi:glycosyltransferase family 4 protein [Paludibacterium yongneupense]|uniref:glycosyltransferase family 4 protein n=1 Tax=Paludibacterium yongneupense TaxID=400061 RepID=UPI0004159A0A|nr:glycosyltransferase family 4 protein [Paludibacterium yongneupense]